MSIDFSQMLKSAVEMLKKRPWWLNFLGYSTIVQHADIDIAEHCIAHPDQLKTIGRSQGHQIRIKRNDTEYAIYTISKTQTNLPKNITLIGSAESRLDTTQQEFPATMQAQVPHPTLNEKDAFNAGEFIEYLTDDGKHKKLIVIAPHGGDIEKWTDQQAEQVISKLNADKISCWCCKGWKYPQGTIGAYARWHITATDIHEASFPKLKQVIDRKFTYAIAFHGFSDNKILIGGIAEYQLKQEIQKAIQAAIHMAIQKALPKELPKVQVEIASSNSKYGGDDPKNIVNRLSFNPLTSQSNGIQIEQSWEARKHYWQDIADAVAAVYQSKLT